MALQFLRKRGRNVKSLNIILGILLICLTFVLMAYIGYVDFAIAVKSIVSAGVLAITFISGYTFHKWVRGK